MKKRILSLVLALSLATSLLPMTAFAFPTGREVYLGTEGISNSSLFFGSYPQTSDGEDGYYDAPIRWRVLDDTAACLVPAEGVTADNFGEGTYLIFDGTDYEIAGTFDEGADYYTPRTTLFLLSNDILDAKAYNTEGTGAAWETATLRSWLNGYGEDAGFIDSAFAPYEAGVLAQRVITDGTADKVFLLAADEATTEDYDFDLEEYRTAYSSDYAKALLVDDESNDWWLRSGGSDAFYISDTGNLLTWPDTQGVIGVRPALMIDYDTVLFSTTADFDNTAPFALTKDSGGIRKLTVWDGAEGFEAEMADTALTPFENATVTVTSLGNGAGYSQISAMLLQEGTVLCYGSIGTASTGDKTFEVPAGLAAGSYTLRLFAESVQGESATNYAGNCVDIEVLVGYHIYPKHTPAMLAGGDRWFVLSDTGTHFTLVKDGFIDGTYFRSEVDMALSNYEDEARAVFGSDATVRLPIQAEVFASLLPFNDLTTLYWLPDEAYTGRYTNARGYNMVSWYSPEDYAEDILEGWHIRPVVTVSKAALRAVPPTVTGQPQNTDFMALDGDDATFTVEASGMNLLYQWQVKVGESFSDITGANDATLTVSSHDETYAVGKTFRCLVDSDWGVPVYSGEASFVIFDWQQYAEVFASSGTDYTVSPDGNTVTLHTAAGLGWLASRVNSGYDYFSGKTVTLAGDIDLTGRTFVPIGDNNHCYDFQGHFDGGMHKVSGMAVQGLYHAGFFGQAREAVIENLILTDGSVGLAEEASDYNSYYMAPLCAHAVNTTFRNIGVGPVAVSTRGDESYYQFGGIVGYLYNEFDENGEKGVYNCYSRALITGGGIESSAGGIAGILSVGTTQNCYYAGTIDSMSSYVGGIAAIAEDNELTNCYWLADDGIPCAYYGYDEFYDYIPINTGCTSQDGAGLKSTATVTALNQWATAGNTTEGPGTYKTWTVKADVNGGYPSFGTVTPSRGRDDDDTPARTITVDEVSAPLFGETKGTVKATADMDNAFSASVEVKLTDSDEDSSGFSLGAGQKAYPFDISLYLKGTSTKVEPKDGYAVTISLPIPEDLLAEKEQLKIVHKAADGTVTTLASELKQIDGVWYLVFKASEFSPYALVIESLHAYDGVAGLPCYSDGEKTVFIGFAANGKYIAPEGVSVLFLKNPKDFTDTAAHWAAPYIRFVAERELFTGTAENVFSPDDVMTRAMFATVLGRLYERSFGKVQSPDAVAFTDCDYSLYYGTYVNWATANGILTGYGDGLYGPNDPITREQMAAILYRFAQFMGLPQPDGSAAAPFADEAAIPAYALPGANFCKGSGILTGREDGSFAPKDTATRAEVAASIERLVEYVVK